MSEYVRLLLARQGPIISFDSVDKVMWKNDVNDMRRMRLDQNTALAWPAAEIVKKLRLLCT
jgi:hypothetical protein